MRSDPMNLEEVVSSNLRPKTYATLTVDSFFGGKSSRVGRFSAGSQRWMRGFEVRSAIQSIQLHQPLQGLTSRALFHGRNERQGSLTFSRQSAHFLCHRRYLDSCTTSMKMKRDASPAAIECPPVGEECISHGVANSDDATVEAARSNSVTPTKTVVSDDITPPASKCSVRPTSSCKRRRLDSNEENIEVSRNQSLYGGSARKLNYETNDSDASDDSDDDGESVGHELAQARLLKRIRSINCEDEDGDQLLHTSAFAKLFEYIKPGCYDVDAKRFVEPSSSEGSWKYRGRGSIKFIKCMEEGYNLGMIRLEMIKPGTLEAILRHELTHEEVRTMFLLLRRTHFLYSLKQTACLFPLQVVPMPSKKGKSYTWIAKDWAFNTSRRTFAIRFDDDLQALEWKTRVEQSKVNNQRVRRGLDIPDLSALDDVCATFLSTRLSPKASAPSP